MGEKRDAYVAKMRNKLRTWSAEIDKMDAGAPEVGVGTRQNFQKLIADLQAKRKDVSLKVERLRQAGEAGWKNMKIEVDSSWKALDKAVHAAMATYKESTLPGRS